MNECLIEEKPNIIFYDVYKKYSDHLEIKKSSNDISKCLRPFSQLFPSHQACIFKTSEHKKILYPKFFGADEYVIRFFLKKGLSNFSFKYVPSAICIFDLKGISSKKKISFPEFLRRLFGNIIMFLPHRILSDLLKIFPLYLVRSKLLSFLYKFKDYF